MLRKWFLLAAILAGLPGGSSAAAFPEDEADIYGEGALPEYKGDDPKDWKEQDWHLPAWPEMEDLLELDTGLENFPFVVLIDPHSLSVGEDRVVRYTVVLRSRSGVDNIAFEGIRCNRKEYQRYAYGSNGSFQLSGDSGWKHYRDSGISRYRTVLTRDYFCPLNGREPRRYIIDKLKHYNPRDWSYSDE